MKVLKGTNYFLYFLVCLNITLGLVILHFQKYSFESPQASISPAAPTLDFKGVIKFAMINTNILPTNDLKRYFRIAPVLILEKEEVLSETRIKESLIRDKIISYLNTQSESDLLSEKGMDMVRDRIKEIINKLLDQNKVTMVYFREFRVN